MKGSLWVIFGTGLNSLGKTINCFMMLFREYMPDILVNIFYNNRFEGVADSCNPHVFGFYYSIA